MSAIDYAPTGTTLRREALSHALDLVRWKIASVDTTIPQANDHVIKTANTFYKFLCGKYITPTKRK